MKQNGISFVIISIERGVLLKYLLYGVGLSVIGVILSVTIFGIDKAHLLTGSIGIICIAGSVIASGSLGSFGSLGSEDRISDDRMRASFANESPEDRNKRFRISINSLLLGLPSIVIAAIIYFIVI